ncbi:hypothetical protein O3G_MSEX008971 [Manduca sexta]|uniref:Uncharacterized protein n=1 Tax=Manduca sexta TaxID=7130 RepID=A0A921ZBL5_MANSE|nr:hypothetical protein O3G_MSEX008971 [Manduca sexta]
MLVIARLCLFFTLVVFLTTDADASNADDTLNVSNLNVDGDLVVGYQGEEKTQSESSGPAYPWDLLYVRDDLGDRLCYCLNA